MSQLVYKERQAGYVTVLDLSGEIRIGESATVLRTAIRNTLAKGNKKIVLDLAGVRYIDSSAMGELIANYTSVRRDGGELKLLNLTERVRDLMVITKLVTIFDVYDHEADALRSFSPGSELCL